MGGQFFSPTPGGFSSLKKNERHNGMKTLPVLFRATPHPTPTPSFAGKPSRPEGIFPPVSPQNKKINFFVRNRLLVGLYSREATKCGFIKTAGYRFTYYSFTPVAARGMPTEKIEPNEREPMLRHYYVSQTGSPDETTTPWPGPALPARC